MKPTSIHHGIWGFIKAGQLSDIINFCRFWRWPAWYFSYFSFCTNLVFAHKIQFFILWTLYCLISSVCGNYLVQSFEYGKKGEKKNKQPYIAWDSLHYFSGLSNVWKLTTNMVIIFSWVGNCILSDHSLDVVQRFEMISGKPFWGDLNI